jgi:hypothetical protein
MDMQDHVTQAPKVSDALKRGTPVTVTTWGGKQVEGTVCDREQAGLLVDPGDSNGDCGYVFLPWSSVEQVNIRGVAHRRVKILQS